MLYEKQSDKIPKKINEKISKFQYYTTSLFSDLFEHNNLTQNNQNTPYTNKIANKLFTKQGNRNIVYNYFYSECQNQALFDASSILISVKKLYLNQDVIKINEMSYSRESLFKQSFLPVYGFFSEIIDFVLIVNNINNPSINQKIQKVSSNVKANLKSNSPDISLAAQQLKAFKSTTSQLKEYSLYVIHNSNSFNPQSEQIKKISWEYFIQRYSFSDKKSSNEESFIKYELIYSYKSNSSLFSFEDKLTQEFIKSHCKLNGKSLQNLEKLQGYLLQKSSEVEKIKKIQQDVAFSDQHKRQTKIPVEHYKHFVSLRKQIYKQYLEINNLQSQDDVNKYFYDNLICRYLVAKEYNFEQAKKYTIEYLKWEKEIKTKYPSIETLKDVHEIGAYRYIGEDFMGRPVVLSKAALVDVTKMPTNQAIDRYCDYYIYFLEIYLRTKMRGYVDQMIVIGDLANLGTKNFKLAITKRNVADSLKYGPQRQYALITVNVSTFAYTAWTFIKPLLPKKTLHKIEIVGSNKKDIIESLITKMDISVIPEYLGGQKKDFNSTQTSKNDNIEQAFERNQTNSDNFDEYQAISTVQVESRQIRKQTNVFNYIFESVVQMMNPFKK